MISVYALGRLILRPAALLLAFLALVASGFAFVLELEPDVVVSAAITEPTSLQASALVRFAVLLPTAVALAVSLLANEARHTELAWTLPRFADALLQGKAILATALAAALALLAAGGHGANLGLAVFGLAILSFAAGGFVADPLTRKIWRLAALALLAMPVFGPEFLPLMGMTPAALFALFSATVFLTALRCEFSPALGRERPFVYASGMSSDPAMTRSYWARATAPDTEWRGVPRSGRVRDWLRAAYYEVSGRRRSGLLGLVVAQYVLIGLFAYMWGEPAMVAYIPAMLVAGIGLQLRGKFLYPVARRQRARIAYWGRLLETTTISVLATLTLAILYEVGVRVDPLRIEQSFADALPLVLLVFAWAPIGHAGTIGGATLYEPRSARQWLTLFVPVAGWLALAMLSHQAYAEVEPFASMSRGAGVALLGALILATQTIHWFALQWYYARRDIVLAPAS